MRKSSSGHRLLLGATLALAGVLACDQQGAGRGNTSPPTGPPPLSDSVPPEFSDPRPAPDTAIVNSTVFSIAVSDDGSGVGEVTATTSQGDALRVTRAGSRFQIDVADLEDGPRVIDVQAVDAAGNESSFSFSHVLDRTAPTITLEPVPDPSLERDGASTFVAVGGTILDPHLENASLEIRDPGPDAVCGTPDDLLWPQGSEPGTVSLNRLDLEVVPGALRTADEARFDVEIELWGPEDRGATFEYCFFVEATDSASDPDGNPSPNLATQSRKSTVNWIATPSFSVQIDTWFETFVPSRTAGAQTGLCAEVRTTPARPSADYSGTLTGPNVDTTLSGTLDDAGAVSLREVVGGDSGDYTWVVSIEDAGERAEVRATVSVSQGGGGRTCQ